MALPTSGPISFNAINVELGVAGTTQASLGQPSYRNLAGVPTGAISLNNFYGKSSVFNGTITTNQKELNLRAWALANGWNGVVAATITINSGVYIWSDNTGVAGLTIDGSWPDGLTLVNNGFIIGKGGQGGEGPRLAYQSKPAGPNSGAGYPGGPAVSLQRNTSIVNNGYIAGGGGGGASGNIGGAGNRGGGGGGGGAGGGRGGQGSATGYLPIWPNNQYSGTFGSPGSIGQSGTAGSSTLFWVFDPGYSEYIKAGDGGGGGRILPGSGGSGGTAVGSTSGGTVTGGTGGGSAGGGGGGLYQYFTTTFGAQAGGAGGSANAVGTNTTGTSPGGGPGGGGWGANGGSTTATTGTPGGAGGRAIQLNGFSVSLSGSGIQYGAVS